MSFQRKLRTNIEDICESCQEKYLHSSRKVLKICEHCAHVARNFKFKDKLKKNKEGR